MGTQKKAVVHYHEIALKGKNRAFFEKALIGNMRAQAAGFFDFIERIPGRILASYDPVCEEKLIARLVRVFGIHHIDLAFETAAEIASMKKVGLKIFSKMPGRSFRVTASRAEKAYPFTSPEIENSVGDAIHTSLALPVSLRCPDVELRVEVAGRRAYLSTARVSGPGGLPVGVSGKVVSLLSGGFDSPVATILLMKRGSVPCPVHFYSYPYTSRDAVENVKKLTEIISRFSPYKIELTLLPFRELQRFVVEHIPSALRVVMYRRWMLWIAERIALEKKAQALVTGDSVGQVASQTLENIRTISEIASLPILRPLAGLDKQEIINSAKHYGTYDISKLPFADCCSLFVSGSPRTKTTIEEIKKIEEPLFSELEKIAGKVLTAREVVTIP